MKNKLWLIALIAVIGFSMIACDNGIGGDTGGDTGSKPGSKPGGNDSKRYVLDISEYSDWDYMVVGDDGSSLVFSVDETTNIPTRAYLKPKKDSDDGFTYLFKENGLPDMMIYNGHIVYFGNYDQYKFDMGVIKPSDNTVRSVQGRSIMGRSIDDDYYDDDADYYFDLECDIDMDAFKAQMARAKDTLWNVAKAELDVFGKILGTISCISTIGFPPGYIGCGIFILSTITGEVVDIAFEGTANNVLQTVLSALNCATGDPVDCTSTFVGIIELLTRKDIETISKNPEKVNEVIKRIEKEQFVPVDDVTIAPAASVAAGGTKKLFSVVTPDNATNKMVTWTSNNPSIATVNCLGDVTGVKEGTARITATSLDGKKKATCTVTVTPTIHVTGVTLDKTTLSLIIGHYYSDQLTVTILPSNATIKDTTWTSSNVNVATVDTWGGITTKSLGTTTITVTTVDSNKTATCVLTVTPEPPPVAVTGVILDKITLSLPLGTSERLVATILPSDAKDKYFEWSSSNENIATVRRAIGPDGIVTGVAEGTATITATARDGNFKASCAVTVTAVSTDIIIEMVSIPAGTFIMGTTSWTFGDWEYSKEYYTPHSVTLSSFKMSKYEVTQEQYQAVMGTNPSNFNEYFDLEIPYLYATGETYNKRPVERVSWYDALVFCNKLSIKEGLTPAYSISGKTNPDDWGAVPTWIPNATWDAVVIVAGSTGYRLPTEAQWEYACRAGTTTAYNTGDTFSDNTGWCYENCGFECFETYDGHIYVYTERLTHEVGKKPANDWGLFDMHGNVYEWCWDWFDKYSSDAQTNPTGGPPPTAVPRRVARGGCWDNDGVAMRSADRHGFNLSSWINNGYYYGLRLVRP
jgi:uncharacterized protein YjdB